ncbi:MAG: transcription-repair coupling factor [Candidatus Omnitrophica bacterium]|nr:transcription-repair coupling factor [Candidatus Omnitrophota bacterium]
MTTFDTIKIYKNRHIDPEDLLLRLTAFGYKGCDHTLEEGDFSRRGEIIECFPLNFQSPVRIELYRDKIDRIASYDLLSGKRFEDHDAIIMLPIKGIRPRRIKKKHDEYGDEYPINNFIDIKPGDHVVHTKFGIGIYRGMDRIKVDKKYIDHLVIEYAGRDTLYVPSSDLNLIQKYVTFHKRPPKLQKLGSRSWQRIKRKAQKGVVTFAYELLEMQAKRGALVGHKFSKDTDWQKLLEDAFAYDETPDQAKSAVETKKDMEKPGPMDRLLCGDVGYGKTEVALRAAFKAVMDSKQVCILVPTTILAEQHYNTFRKRMKDFPVRIEMLSRFRTKTEQSIIVDGLKAGTVDIVIGTHRLLSQDIKIKDLGLLIIDEEQRFGVKAKERIKSLKLMVDVLTLTATPIPRTLYMALVGAKNMSVINTPPAKRLAVKTQVVEYTDDFIKRTARKELKRKGQIFFVHNRVRGIEKIANKLKILLPDARIEVGHGRMTERELEKTMLGFIANKIDILVCTTIIESGIDIPNANTIFINRADTFGLADLYQLRGRVGRFTRDAYAYLLVPKRTTLSNDAQKRLSSIQKFSELGSGFKLAMEDLEIRGAGNLLGSEQHGFVEAVGFDLYCRLLKSAIDTFKN